MAERTSSSVIIHATAEDVVSVIADLESYPEWTGAIHKVEVLQRYPDGWIQRAQLHLDAGIFSDTLTFDYEWDLDADYHGTVSWGLVEAKSVKSLAGQYRLSSVGDDTEVTYELHVELVVAFLGMVTRKAEKMLIGTALGELKSRVEAST